MVDRRRRVAPDGHTDDRPGGRGRARGTLTARAGESGSAFRREMRFMERREGACLQARSDPIRAYDSLWQ